jgi:hypothetical protein
MSSSSLDSRALMFPSFEATKNLSHSFLPASTIWRLASSSCMPCIVVICQKGVDADNPSSTSMGKIGP